VHSEEKLEQTRTHCKLQQYISCSSMTNDTQMSTWSKPSRVRSVFSRTWVSAVDAHASRRTVPCVPPRATASRTREGRLSIFEVAWDRSGERFALPSMEDAAAKMYKHVTQCWRMGRILSEHMGIDTPAIFQELVYRVYNHDLIVLRHEQP